MLISATGGGAQRFSSAARDIFQKHGPTYFGQKIDRDKRGWQHWKILGSPQDKGEVFAAGVGGGGIMGAGADLLIIDDFFRNVEDALSETIRRKQHEWFLSTSSTRMSPRGAIVFVATRWHRKDLIGLAREETIRSGKPWRVLSFEAICQSPNDPLGRQPGEALWPEQWPLELLQERRRSYMDSGYPWMWEALYQQRPPEVLDSTWDSQLFGDHVMFDRWPDSSRIQFRVISLDPSLGNSETSDYSVFISLALDVDGVMWIDADIERRDPVKIVEDGYTIARWFKPDAFGVETNGFQKVLAPMFDECGKREGFRLPLHGIHNHKNKIQRILGTLSPYLKRGEFRFKNNSPGVQLLLEMLRSFPSHRYKDGPDALEMAVRLARHVFSNGADTSNRLPGEYRVVT